MRVTSYRKSLTDAAPAGVPGDSSMTFSDSKGKIRAFSRR